MQTSSLSRVDGHGCPWKAKRLVAIAASCLVVGNGAAQGDVQLVAHRGAELDRPENTMAAFERAVEAGADMVELDVRMNADGFLFVLHDHLLERTTDGEGRAADLSRESLLSLDAGAWFDSAYAGERIPSFEHVLQWSAATGTVLLLDLKERSELFVRRVEEEIQAHGDPALLVVGVRTVGEVRDYRRRLPQATRLLAFMGAPGQIDAFVEAGADIIRLTQGWLSSEPELAERVKQHGVELMINARFGRLTEAQSLEQARRLLAFDPDWIMVSDPCQFRQSLKVAATTDADE